MRRMSQRFASASAFALVLGGAAADAQQYSAVVAFGDSLSDNGNQFALTGEPAAPYWEGRYSNGHVWVEQVANWLGFDPAAITDLAMGGATTRDLLDLQVAPYVAAHWGVIPSDALYTVWAGGNDLLQLMLDPDGDPAQVIGEAMNNLGGAIGLLIASGARHIVVCNMPDLSAIPLVLGTESPELIGQALALSGAFNAAFADLVAFLDFNFGIDLIELDAFTIIKDIDQSPKSFDLKNATDEAYDGATIARKADDYLFWDDHHPTRVGHNAIAGRVVAALGMIWCDLDGSGGVDGADVTLLATSYGPCAGGCRADLNADGVVDSSDLKILQRVGR
jgi:outer membrane lipase/esterase